MPNDFSRRSFLKAAGAGLAGALIAPRLPASTRLTWAFGPEQRLGRVAWPWGVDVMSRPRPDGKPIRKLFPDDVFAFEREIVGLGMMPHNHVWFELEDGFVYSSHAQPARNIVNPPLTQLPPDGLWAEVSIPYVDAFARPSPESRVLYRLYYSAVYRISEILPPVDGAVWYRVSTESTPNLYAPADAFRVILPEEVTPISPDVSDKSLLVNLSDQTITALEGRAEVYRAQMASGAQFYGEDGRTLTGGTATGTRWIWSKRISRQMQGGTLESGYDLPGVGWVSYFSAIGEALHSTYWHNDYGRPKSRGCINLRPHDAKWLFRWSQPPVSYYPGDVIVDWANRGTLVDIRVEA